MKAKIIGNEKVKAEASVGLIIHIYMEVIKNCEGSDILPYPQSTELAPREDVCRRYKTPELGTKDFIICDTTSSMSFRFASILRALFVPQR